MLSRPSHSWDARKWKHFQCYEIQFWCSTTPGRGRRVSKLSRSLRRCFWTKPHLFKNDHHTFSTSDLLSSSQYICYLWYYLWHIFQRPKYCHRVTKNDKYNFHWPFPTCNGWPPHRVLAPLDPQEPDFHLWPSPGQDQVMNRNLVTKSFIFTHFFLTKNIFSDPDFQLWSSPGQDLTLN